MSTNRGPQIAGVAGGFLALAWISTLLRCYTRIKIVKSFGLDDWLALTATILYTPYCAFSITATYYGSGKPIADIPSQDVPIGLKWWWACEPIYVLSGMFIKVSIGVFLLRICVSRAQRMIIYVVEATMCSISSAYFFIFVFQCYPSQYFWTQYTGGKGRCYNADIIIDASYIYSSISCVVDWTLGLLPIALVWNLQMDIRTKASVAVILAVGAVASTTTIIRIPTLSSLSDTSNFLYATADVAIWSTIENGLAISASALATFRPLFRNCLDSTKLISSRAQTPGWNARKSRAGYLRSEGNEAIGLNLRSNNKNDAVVTTTIKAGSINQSSRDESEQITTQGNNRKNNFGRGNWKNDNSSEDMDWSRGITKTMEVRTNNEMV